MNQRACLLLLIGLAVYASGCATTPKPDTDVPPPTITDAHFLEGEPDTALITGEFFKMASDNKQDVIVSLNGHYWEPCKSISKSSPTSYTVLLPYGVDFPQVWVRVYGMNETYSQPALVLGINRQKPGER